MRTLGYVSLVVLLPALNLVVTKTPASAALQYSQKTVARSAARSLAVAIVTFHGQIVDETPRHQTVGNMKMMFCNAVNMTHPKGAVTCGRHYWRLTTDGKGRFAIPNFNAGVYIFAGRSPDVGWFESFDNLRPSSDEKPHLMFVCSYRTEPQRCAPPSSGRNIPL
jgi:hypothetical protein